MHVYVNKNGSALASCIYFETKLSAALQTIMHNKASLIVPTVLQTSIDTGSLLKKLLGDISTLWLKFIYSEKATKFCEISTNYLSYVLPVK